MSFLIDNLRAEGLVTQRFSESGPVERILLERMPDGSEQTVDVPTFLGFFGAILADPAISDNYAALMALDASSDLGYSQFFTAWRDAGISFVGVDAPDVKETSGFKGFLSRFFGG